MLNWAIIGTGGIAHAFAKGLAESKTGKLVAVGSRSQATADKFGDEFSIPAGHRHGSYEAMLADAEVQAVYISTPHPAHAEWAIKCAEAKKHILCEKPLALNFADAEAMVEAAMANDVFLMEAFMYRCHPQTAKLVELIKANTIGKISVITATFSFHWPKPFNAHSRLTSNALGGGGILDVGCYTTSMARLIAGVANGREGVIEPVEVKAVGHLESTGIDGYTIASVKFPGDILAQLSTGVQSNQNNEVRIYGSEGHIHLPGPWFCSGDIVVTRGDKSETIKATDPRNLYTIEADTCAEAIARGDRQATFPSMNWADTLGNMKLLDTWRGQIGLMYDQEKHDKLTTTLTRRPLKVGPKHYMKYGRIPGIDKPVSRLAAGADFSGDSPRQFNVIADDFFERGGNMFDTAWLYYSWGPLFSDIAFGSWMKSRGVRNDVVILAKGGHTPHCNPKMITKQLMESLEMLQTDHVDIYMMHRDNLEIPVSEFVDVLNEHKKAGRIKVFGGSNWSVDRVEAANKYAASKNLQGFSVVSNNFSLARLVDPVWPGAISASDKVSRDWFTKTQMTLIPWSSQARGFFVPGRAAPDKREDADMTRCWYSEDNFKRLDRATELAKKYAVSPINIALAYVLCQPFPTFPLIGPRQLSETRTSLPALDVALTAEELRYLNLED